MESDSSKTKSIEPKSLGEKLMRKNIFAEYLHKSLLNCKGEKAPCFYDGDT